MSKKGVETRITLLRRLSQQYDDYSWQEFVSYYQTYIRMILFRLGIKEQDMDDLLQETLLKIWKSLPDFEKRDNVKFRSWLYIVIRSCAYNWHSKYKKNRKLISLDGEGSFELSVDSRLEDIIESEWKKYITGLAWENIREHFSTDALGVFDFAMKGKSNSTIAEEMGMKANTVAVYKKRVKQALYHEIARLDYELNN